MIEFVVRPHAVRSVDIVEVWRDGAFVATITPSPDERALRVITKYAIATTHEPPDAPAPNAVTITIGATG